MAITLNITVADQPGDGGGGGDPGGPGGGGSGTSVTDTATWQGITFTLSQNCTVGYLADGKPFFVYPGSATTVSWSPAETTAGGLAVNCGMKNPDRGLRHAFDARETGYFDATLKATSPVSMAAGDSLVVQNHNPNPTTASGGTSSHPVYSLAYSAILCVAAEPAAHSYIPAVGPYSAGGTARPVYVLDVTTLTFPSYTIGTLESMSIVLNRLGRYSPVGSLVRGVEQRRQLTPSGITDSDGYGRSLAATMAKAGIRLIGNDSTADKRTLAKYMMMHFAEWYPAVKANGTKWNADGGQNQGLILPVILGLGWLGDTTALSTLLGDVRSNELDGTFRLDSTLLAKVRDPHDNVGATWPQTTLRRTVSAVNGNAITFTDGLSSWGSYFSGTLLVRESDGATARVVSTTTATKTQTIDAQPGSPFAIGNVCFNRAGYSQSVGDEEWTIKGLTSFTSYDPTGDASYRNLNEWDGQVMCVQAFGFMHSAWDFWRDYVVRANANGAQSGSDDVYADHFVSTDTKAFWDTHWTAISAVSQTVG